MLAHAFADPIDAVLHLANVSGGMLAVLHPRGDSIFGALDVRFVGS